MTSKPFALLIHENILYRTVTKKRMDGDLNPSDICIIGDNNVRISSSLGKDLYV